MKKTAFFLFFAVFITVQRAPAQNAPADTTRIIVIPQEAAQIAGEDVKIFKLPLDVLKKFKKAHFPKTSDYFKPTKQYASNYALLNDSDYVQAFRKAAYKKSLRQPVHPTGTFLLILGAIVGGIVFIGFLLAPVANNAPY